MDACMSKLTNVMRQKLDMIHTGGLLQDVWLLQPELVVIRPVGGYISLFLEKDVAKPYVPM